MERLLEILEELHSDIDYSSCDTLVDDGILDSFDIVSLVTEINDEFDVKIPASEIIPDNFNSAESLWELIQRLMDE